MNSRTLTCIAMALLAVLATPVRLAAQDNGDHNQQKHVRYAIECSTRQPFCGQEVFPH